MARDSGLEIGDDGRQRVVIEGVCPEIDAGRFPIKRTTGDEVVVEADIFADGNDVLSALLLHRRYDAGKWTESPMEPLGNDRWRGSFRVGEPGRHLYTLMACVDHFETWRWGLEKKLQASQDVSLDLLVGADLLEGAAKRATGPVGQRMRKWVWGLRDGDVHPAEKSRLALSEEVAWQMGKLPDVAGATRYHKELVVVVDRAEARFSAWYEMFPRSSSPEPGRHGTFRDCEARLPYVASMGFDVLYLPPIHPIGRTNRKGKNNAPAARPDAPGSPWAIGSADGGHRAVHPELGTLDDFRRLVAKARQYGIEVALDLAFQCSPDPPYVAEHPEWFRLRPDGSVQYAENPPKKYEDIYPFDFGTERSDELWEELKSVVLFWIEQGVRIFRADNPHTKPFQFWEWLIAEIKEAHPDVIFLSEAFTRPRAMYRLAKLGFSQSYTYFAWRNTKAELTQYFTELAGKELSDFFRPSLWPNTPDILHEYLQLGGRPASIVRLVLAATLSASYGIYGPPFELGETRPREPGTEEYLDSEKYELRHWDLEHPDSLKGVISTVNAIRRENPALQRNDGLVFHDVGNDQLLCFSKRTEDPPNIVLVAVNLDPRYTQSGWVNLSLDRLGLSADETYQVHDLLGGGRYLWTGARNYVELNPHVLPAHIFRVRRRQPAGDAPDHYV